MRTGALDMNGVYASLLRAAPGEVRRVERLEMLDELEEWRLIQAHYCMAWGANDAASQDGGGGCGDEGGALWHAITKVLAAD